MKEVNWILEKHIFDYESEIVEVINSFDNSNCYVFDDTDIVKFDFDRDIKNIFTEKDVVTFHGSFQRGLQIQRYTNLTPGVFITLDNYECFKYYPYYGDYMLNSDYFFVSLRSLLSTSVKNRVFDAFNTDKIFVRPSNGYKTFTGQLISKDNWDYEIDILTKSYGGLHIDQLVMVSSAKKVREENRVIVSNIDGRNIVVDHNTYMIDKNLVSERTVDNKVLRYIRDVLDRYTQIGCLQWI